MFSAYIRVYIFIRVYTVCKVRCKLNTFYVVGYLFISWREKICVLYLMAWVCKQRVQAVKGPCLVQGCWRLRKQALPRLHQVTAWSLVFAEGLQLSSLLLCTVSPGMHDKIAGLLCSTVSQSLRRAFYMYTFPTPIKPYLVNHNPSLHSNT